MHLNEQADTHFQAAVAAHQRGDLGTAERCYREALALVPEHSAASNNLGLCLAMAGRLDEALDCFRQAREAAPDSGDAAVNLAQALQQNGRVDEALAAWREAAALLPGHMEPSLAAALLATERGDIDTAVSLLTEAATRTPQRDGTRALFTRLTRELAARCIDDGDLSNAHRLASTLLRTHPDDGVAAHLLEECLRHARVQHFDASIRDDLLNYHRSGAVEHHELSRITCELLAAGHPQLRGEDVSGDLSHWAAGGLHQDELLELLLTRGLVATAPVERALTALRRALLLEGRDGALPDEHWRRFTAALALQCFSNEYQFSVTEEEERGLQALGSRAAKKPENADAFALLACYRAPDPSSPSMPGSGDDVHTAAWLMQLLVRTVQEPRQELTLRRQFQGAAIDDAVSVAVRNQYEESPYPRWQNLERQPPMTVPEFLHHEIPHATQLTPAADAHSILIAGCGTGAHALRVAVRHPMCQVTAMDLSTTSLAYGMRKARELGIGNVAFHHQDILTLPRAEGPFDLIESVGVLHHMNEPAAGLAALVEVLAERGVIKLGLYSRLARRNVNRARARIAELRLEATPAGIRTLRQRIIAGEEPELEPLLGSLDFYTMSAVRDLLFHVQEHQFDARGLSELLDGCSLRSIGFQVSPSTRRRYLARFPDDPQLANLVHWDAFEAEFPETFVGMYQFWCVRDGR